MAHFLEKIIIFFFGIYGRVFINWLNYREYVRPIITKSEFVDSVNTAITGVAEFHLIDENDNITKIYIEDIEDIVGILDNYTPGTIYNPKERILNQPKAIMDSRNIVRNIIFLSIFEKIVVVDYITDSHDVMFIHRNKVLILPVELFEEYFNLNGDKIKNNIIRLEP